MNIPSAISDFIFELEEGLSTSFSQKQSTGAVVLRSDEYALILVLYWAERPKTTYVGPVRTVHIDQDQILKNPTKILYRLFSLVGKGAVIYARQTVAARIEKRVALGFLEENHLQAAIPGKYRYGLFHVGELVSVALFSGGRHMREQAANYRSFELLRFCHKSGHRVVGGLSKLLKAFTNDFHPQDIMTYVDRDWSQHSNLRTLGFEVQGDIAPQTFWIADKERYYITDANQLSALKTSYPNGYLSQNSGSTKLVLKFEAGHAPIVSQD